MPEVHSALIHEFDGNGPPHFDDEGDQCIGCYYQFVDKDELPVAPMVGPYLYRELAEAAAKTAFRHGDF